MKLRAYAKINLMLDIVSRLENGMHSLCMLMQSVGLYDELCVEKAESGIELSCSDLSVPVDNSNTAYRAAELFFEAIGIHAGAKINIIKNIPHSAGLAGGSADAAAVLVGLNALYAAGLSETELCSLGLRIGADVPFCICGGTRLAQDVGQVLSELPPLKDSPIVLVKPNCGVSTAQAYAAFDSAERVRHLNVTAMINAAANADFDKICSLCGNVFEQFIEVPERVGIRSVMRKYSARVCCMSGSGPTVFGIFTDDALALDCAAAINETRSLGTAYLCRPVSCGVEIIR